MFVVVFVIRYSHFTMIHLCDKMLLNFYFTSPHLKLHPETRNNSVIKESENVIIEFEIIYQDISIHYGIFLRLFVLGGNTYKLKSHGWFDLWRFNWSERAFLVILNASTNQLINMLSIHLITYSRTILTLSSFYFTVTAIVEFDYVANEPDELTISKGQTIVNVKTQPGGWWFGTQTSTGKSGMFPDNFVKLIDQNDDKVILRWVFLRLSFPVLVFLFVRFSNIIISSDCIDYYIVQSKKIPIQKLPRDLLCLVFLHLLNGSLVNGAKWKVMLLPTQFRSFFMMMLDVFMWN